MQSLKGYLSEGRHDPSIFKAVFMAGAPGAASPLRIPSARCHRPSGTPASSPSPGAASPEGNCPSRWPHRPELEARAFHHRSRTRRSRDHTTDRHFGLLITDIYRQTLLPRKATTTILL